MLLRVSGTAGNPASVDAVSALAGVAGGGSARVRDAHDGSRHRPAAKNRDATLELFVIPAN